MTDHDPPIEESEESAEENYSVEKSLQTIRKWLLGEDVPGKPRPLWQYEAFCRLVSKGELPPSYKEDFFTIMDDEQAIAKTIAEKPLPPPSVTMDRRVCLVGMEQVVNVGGLLREMKLDFALEGMTIFYGDNGSGKSSYARILGNACHSRNNSRNNLTNKQAIIPNLKQQGQQQEECSKALLHYLPSLRGEQQSVWWKYQDGAGQLVAVVAENSNGKDDGGKALSDGNASGGGNSLSRLSPELSPKNSNDALQQDHEQLLKHIRVFDKDSALVHVNEGQEIIYTPYPQQLLEQLVVVCEEMEKYLEEKVEEQQEKISHLQKEFNGLVSKLQEKFQALQVSVDFSPDDLKNSSLENRFEENCFGSIRENPKTDEIFPVDELVEILQEFLEEGGWSYEERDFAGLPMGETEKQQLEKLQRSVQEWAVFGDTEQEELVRVGQWLYDEKKKNVNQVIVRLQKGKEKLQQYRDNFEQAQKMFAKNFFEELQQAGIRVLQATLAVKAAVAKGSGALSDVPPSFGEEAWRKLWDAAREYWMVVDSTQEQQEQQGVRNNTRGEKDFAKLKEGERCVLCWQDLQQQAVSRLQAFDEFVKDKTSKERDEAQSKRRWMWENFLQDVDEFLCGGRLDDLLRYWEKEEEQAGEAGGQEKRSGRDLSTEKNSNDGEGSEEALSGHQLDSVDGGSGKGGGSGDESDDDLFSSDTTQAADGGKILDEEEEQEHRRQYLAQFKEEVMWLLGDGYWSYRPGEGLHYGKEGETKNFASLGQVIAYLAGEVMERDLSLLQEEFSKVLDRQVLEDLMGNYRKSFAGILQRVVDGLHGLGSSAALGGMGGGKAVEKAGNAGGGAAEGGDFSKDGDNLSGGDSGKGVGSYDGSSKGAGSGEHLHGDNSLPDFQAAIDFLQEEVNRLEQGKKSAEYFLHVAKCNDLSMRRFLKTGNFEDEQNFFSAVEKNSLAANSLAADKTKCSGQEYFQQAISHLRAASKCIERKDQLEGYKSQTNTKKLTETARDEGEKLTGKRWRKNFAKELEKFELDYLGLQLADPSAGKGKSYYKIGYKELDLGKYKLGDILSEGEFRGVALAAFLAEDVTEKNYSAVVFDDPVSSLDHNYRSKIAKRLAALTKERQVIVFTHDLMFLWLLQNEVREHSGSVQSCTISRARDFDGRDLIGLCGKGLPFGKKGITDALNAFADELRKKEEEEESRNHSDLKTQNDLPSVEGGSTDGRDEDKWFIEKMGYCVTFRHLCERTVEEAIGIFERLDDKIHMKKLVKVVPVTLQRYQRMYDLFTKYSKIVHYFSKVQDRLPSASEILDDFETLVAWRTEIKEEVKKEVKKLKDNMKKSDGVAPVTKGNFSVAAQSKKQIMHDASAANQVLENMTKNFDNFQSKFKDLYDLLYRLFRKK